MDNSLKKRTQARKGRVQRVRKTLHGNAQRPRLCVLKTNNHLYAQLIDDERSLTLAGVGTVSKNNRATAYNKKSKEAAREIGKQIAHLAKEKEISFVIFDRGRHKFHGLIAELANSAREAGLQF